MRKEIKPYGGTNVITLTKSDLKLYGLNVGDIIELTITKVIPNGVIKEQKKVK